MLLTLQVVAGVCGLIMPIAYAGQLQQFEEVRAYRLLGPGNKGTGKGGGAMKAIKLLSEGLKEEKKA